MHKSGKRKFHTRSPLAASPAKAESPKKRTWKPSASAVSPVVPMLVPPMSALKKTGLKQTKPSKFELNRYCW